MKGVKQILFGCALLLLSVYSGVMFIATEGGYLFLGLALITPLPGFVFAIIGLLDRGETSEEEAEQMERDEENQESKGEENPNQ